MRFISALNLLLVLFYVTSAKAESLTIAPVQRDTKAKNVLLILVDDLKPSFGAYGDNWVHSPNLDRLAAQGMCFDRAYCNQAVCAPSRNHLLVGARSTTLGIYNLGTHFRKAVPDAITLPEYFKQHGYHVEGIGKVFHIGHGNTGDERSWSVPFSPDKVVEYALPESTGGKLTREEALFGNQKLGNIRSLPRGPAWEIADVADDAYADGRIAREGVKRLQSAKQREQPFFLALGFTKPHLPFCAPKKYWDLYDRAALPEIQNRHPPLGSPRYALKPPFLELNQYTPIPDEPPLSAEVEQTLIHGYYAALSYMDAQLGLVLDELERLELQHDTIVILWGDHGYNLGEHGTWTKHANYEQENRIPLLVVSPGVIAPNSRSNALVETVDIYPTLAELAGLPELKVPQPIDGLSLKPILLGSQSSLRDHAYHCFPRAEGRLGRAIRTERYRLVEWKRFGEDTSEAVYELFDYIEDPWETQNLAADRPEIVKQLARILARHPRPKRPI